MIGLEYILFIRGIKNKDMAENLGVSVQLFNYYIKTGNIPKDILIKLTDIFNIDELWFSKELKSRDRVELEKVLSSTEWVKSGEENNVNDVYFLTLKENYKKLFKLYSSLETEKKDKSNKIEELYKITKEILSLAERSEDKELLTLVYSFLSKIQSIRS